MRILIKYRSEAQAQKILDQEDMDDLFQRMVEFGDPVAPLKTSEKIETYEPHEADEILDWISGEYAPIEESTYIEE